MRHTVWALILCALLFSGCVQITILIEPMSAPESATNTPTPTQIIPTAAATITLAPTPVDLTPTAEVATWTPTPEPTIPTPENNLVFAINPTRDNIIIRRCGFGRNVCVWDGDQVAPGEVVQLDLGVETVAGYVQVWSKSGGEMRGWVYLPLFRLCGSNIDCDLRLRTLVLSTTTR